MGQRESDRTARQCGTWPRTALPLASVLACCLMAPWPAAAQAPQVDIDEPPGVSIGRGRLGPPVGASGTSGFDASSFTDQQTIVGGRVGPSVTRVPFNQLAAPTAPVPSIRPITPPTSVQPANIPQYGELDLTDVMEEGPPDGLTLDTAIQVLLARNLGLLALKFEVSMAQADVLTAGLRANPIFYADAQLVPYGRYSKDRPGGQTQYDVNVTLPIDVWRKRHARTLVAQQARRVTEAQFQNAVRQQLDNLYTVYVDVVAADLTLKFSVKYAEGLQNLLRLNEQLRGAGFIKPSDLLAIQARIQLAELQIREATQTRAKTLRTLGFLLDLPRDESDRLQLRSRIHDPRPLPTTLEGLIETSLNARPDLASFRAGLHRAHADVQHARAQRYSDVYLLYQPYTFQDNTPQGLKSVHSYALGVTVALPLFNRNQGNIMRAELNARQSGYELANQEKQVVFDVEEAVREYSLSLDTVVEFRKEVVPASREVRDVAFRRWQGGETSALDYLEAQQDYNDVVRQYRDALVRHRRAMLDLNTAVGTRVVP